MVTCKGSSPNLSQTTFRKPAPGDKPFSWDTAQQGSADPFFALRTITLTAPIVTQETDDHAKVSITF